MDCPLHKQSSIFAEQRQIKQLSLIRKQLAKTHKSEISQGPPRVREMI